MTTQETFRSEAITRGVRVEVQSRFDPSRSKPESGHWFFLYTIRISNEGDDVVQLLTRHWIIRDESGQEQEVRGPGVVGEQPVLAPGEGFEYTSGCPLSTATGTMRGSYRMVVLPADGAAPDPGSPDAFDAEVAEFLLSEPYAAN